MSEGTYIIAGILFGYFFCWLSIGLTEKKRIKKLARQQFEMLQDGKQYIAHVKEGSISFTHYKPRLTGIK